MDQEIYVMRNLCTGVMVFQRSMAQLEQGGGVCLHWYLCIHLYVKCSWCSGLAIDLWSIGGRGEHNGVCLYALVHLPNMHNVHSAICET